MSATVSYQVEASPIGKSRWEQVKPLVTDREEGLTLIRAKTIEAKHNPTGFHYRLVQITREVIAASEQEGLSS